MQHHQMPQHQHPPQIPQQPEPQYQMAPTTHVPVVMQTPVPIPAPIPSVEEKQPVHETKPVVAEAELISFDWEKNIYQNDSDKYMFNSHVTYTYIEWEKQSADSKLVQSKWILS